MSNWSTHQLTEYFTAVNASADESSALAGAVERAAEMVEAEVGAVVIDGGVYGAWGFGSDVPVPGLLAVDRGAGRLTAAGVGELEAVPSSLGADIDGTLIVARHDDPFTPEERQMLQGMAQVLGLALRSIRVLEDERALRADRERETAIALARQRLVETLLTIQRAISNRKPLPEILDAVTSGASALLGGATVALMLAEGGQGRRLTVASTAGEAGDLERAHSEAREAMATALVQIRPLERDHPEKGTVIAAPVRVTGEMAGSMVAQLPGGADRYGERDLLAAFAQQVSLALTDARTVEAVHEAHHDPITGLPNRALFLKIFNRVLASRGMVTDPTSVLFIDLDRFKGGLIVDIGQWVLETSAMQVAAWRRSFPDLTLNVNVSGHQLVHPRFADNVMRALGMAGMPSSAVTLELTESVLMSDPDRGVAALGALRELGVQLSIDDFGTGYSSLAYLRELPVDELKIDRAFIARAELTGEDLALVRTIVELGTILGLRVVAEGIENAAQLAALRRLGCALGQGYHLCRPANAEDLPPILGRPSLLEAA